MSGEDLNTRLWQEKYTSLISLHSRGIPIVGPDESRTSPSSSFLLIPAGSQGSGTDPEGATKVHPRLFSFQTNAWLIVAFARGGRLLSKQL